MCFQPLGLILSVPPRTDGDLADVSKLKQLKRKSKWRENFKAHIQGMIDAGIPVYGVREDGKYVKTTKEGDTVIEGRSMIGKSVLANRALAKQE